MPKTILDLLNVAEDFAKAVYEGRNAAHSETKYAIPPFSSTFEKVSQNRTLGADSRMKIKAAEDAMTGAANGSWENLERLRRRSVYSLTRIKASVEFSAPVVISAVNTFAAVVEAENFYSTDQLRALIGPENRTEEISEGFTALGGKADFLAKLCKP